MKILNKILILLIGILRPFLGPPARCYFEPTCTPYALEQLKKHHVIRASYNIIKRVLSCNPISQWLWWY